jgi:hypothetical protein
MSHCIHPVSTKMKRLLKKGFKLKMMVKKKLKGAENKQKDKLRISRYMQILSFVTKRINTKTIFVRLMVDTKKLKKSSTKFSNMYRT